MNSSELAPRELKNKIHVIRGLKVMLDSDLADLYGVETKTLNRVVKRNLSRFPADFMFQLTSEEFENLKYQFGTSSSSHGGRRKLPYAFTQEGVAMLSGVLNSERAIQVNVAIMRTFVQLRSLISEDRDLLAKLRELEQKYDRRFKFIFDAIQELMSTHAVPRKRVIGLGKE